MSSSTSGPTTYDTEVILDSGVTLRLTATFDVWKISRRELDLVMEVSEAMHRVARGGAMNEVAS